MSPTFAEINSCLKPDSCHGVRAFSPLSLSLSLPVSLPLNNAQEKQTKKSQALVLPRLWELAKGLWGRAGSGLAALHITERISTPRQSTPMLQQLQSLKPFVGL